MTEHYDRSFYAALNEASDESAARILSIVLDLAPSASAVDVGCGIGIWAQTLQRLGVKDVLAIDGDYIPRDQLRIDARNFQAHDISRSFDLGRTFDLAVCVEVAEHLDGNRADGFIADLVRLAPVIVFSAAAPRQGGVHHVNEQWPDYWIDRFNEQGYSCWDALRPQIRYNPNVAWIYRQNVILAIGPGSSLLDRVRDSYLELRTPEPGDVAFDYVARYILEYEESAKEVVKRAVSRRFLRLGRSTK